MRDDEFENYGEGILGGVEDNSDFDSDSEYLYIIYYKLILTF